jgi:hypothetical protein
MNNFVFCGVVFLFLLVLVQRAASRDDLDDARSGGKGTDTIRDAVGQLAVLELVAVHLPQRVENTKHQLHLQVDTQIVAVFRQHHRGHLYIATESQQKKTNY